MALEPQTLRVSEVFWSLQGEGPSAGMPSTFLRLAGCNLKCAYCDTPYTWDSTRFDLAKQSRTTAISALAEELAQQPLRRLIVTGGEPMLQQSGIAKLLQVLPRDVPIEIESNATIGPSPELAQRIDQWNLSPKLPSSEMGAEVSCNWDVLRQFLETRRAYLKLVVKNDTDLSAADELVRRLRWPTTHILLMPEGRTTATLEERSPWVAEAAMARGYRFTTRLHVLLWGDERGR